MGFNLGSTKIRTVWTGATERYYFESALERLMKDFGYRDVYSAGLDYAAIDTLPPDEKIHPHQSLSIATTTAYRRSSAKANKLKWRSSKRASAN